MRLAKLTLLGALMAGALGSAAQAQDATSNDVRCVMVGMAMTNAPDPKLKTGGMIAIYYYLGRLDARGGTGDIETRIRTEAKTMTKEKFQLDSKRCGDQLNARQQTLQALGSKLSATPPAAKPPAAK